MVLSGTAVSVFFHVTPRRSTTGLGKTRKPVEIVPVRAENAFVSTAVERSRQSAQSAEDELANLFDEHLDQYSPEERERRVARALSRGVRGRNGNSPVSQHRIAVHLGRFLGQLASLGTRLRRLLPHTRRPA